MPLRTRLNFRKLVCRKTTEAGQDELYILVIRTTSEGGYAAYRLPAPEGHWDIKDNGEQTWIGNTCIHQIDLDRGEKANIYVRIMEEDGGLPGNWAEEVGGALAAIPNAYTQAIGAGLQVIGGVFNQLGVIDTDDFPGSFGVEFENRNGSLDGWHWEAGERAQTAADIPGLDHSCRIDFYGDGSNYFGEFYLDVI